MLKFSNDKLRSFIFALLYGLAPYHLYLSPVNWVIGEFTAYTFIPIVFLGIYEILRRNEKEWPLLAIGVALLMLSHLLSVALCAEIFVVLLLIACSFDLQPFVHCQRLLVLSLQLLLNFEPHLMLN